MSIYRQLWLAIIGLTILAFTGSFVVSLYTARAYIAQQLYMKNVDNASSLALVLSQMPDKDPVTVELLISAQFDTGHYQEILLTDPKQNTLVARSYSGTETGAPEWFIKLFPLRVEPGVALVQDGWKQYGTIKLVSHNRFAYKELWGGMERLAIWFAFAGVAAGIAGTILLNFLFRPLGRVVEQARAIQERRFVTVEEPATPELRSVVVAMNAMVSRLKAIFSEEASRIDELRRKVNHDTLTGLPNREYFISVLNDSLTGDCAATTGSLALVRISQLERINSMLGHQQTDRLIQDIGEALQSVGEKYDNSTAARLNGSDFALLTVGITNTEALTDDIHASLQGKVISRWPQVSDICHTGIVTYLHGEAIGDILASADKALAVAEAKGANAIHTADTQETPSTRLTCESWRAALSEAIQDGRIRLERYPVLAASSQTMHQESAARVQVAPEGPWLPAGDFMPMALRLKLSPSIDMSVVQLALDQLDEGTGEIAVNLSAETIGNWHFNDELIAMLAKRPDRTKRLWIEVPEYGAFRNFDAFRSFCHRLDPLGCKLGIEHFGQHFSEIAKLAELGLDYLKIDSNYIRDIDKNTGNQEFLRGLCRVAHNAGVLTIAEGVVSEEELSMLLELGFDGATGREITRRAGN